MSNRFKQLISLALTLVTVFSLGAPALANTKPLVPYYSDKLLATLDKNGKYPVNSKGESYGSSVLSDLVGEKPDLWLVQGLSGNHGYYREKEIETVKITTLAEAEAYAKRPRWATLMNLYDQEGVVVVDHFIVGHTGDPVKYDGLTYPTIEGALMAARNSYSADLLATLDKNGKYPVNAKGETYGDIVLSGRVGKAPDLITATGTKGEKGYYREKEAAPQGDSADGNYPSRLISLYDKEGVVIGQYATLAILDSMGGQKFPTVAQAQAAAAGDYSRKLLATLDGKGQYRVNAKGETYGPGTLSDLVGKEPDLIFTTGLRGDLGYYRYTETEPVRFTTPEEVAAYQETHKYSLLINLYDKEGLVIVDYYMPTGGTHDVKYSGKIYPTKALALAAATDMNETATPTAATVVINGKSVSFDSYTIEGSNFFKLRDIAKAVSGTDKQFNVTWDSAKNAINLLSKKAYTPVGGEMTKGDGFAKSAVVSNANIFADGKSVGLDAYTMGGNNYFKLRDLCQLFNISVLWDGKTSTITINTALPYSE